MYTSFLVRHVEPLFIMFYSKYNRTKQKRKVKSSRLSAINYNTQYVADHRLFLIRTALCNMLYRSKRTISTLCARY